jgi:hypothetical protein
MAGRKPYQKGSIADWADRAFTDIKKLSESAHISEKLIAFCAIIFVLIFGVDIAFWLNKMATEPLGYVILLAISMLFSLILSLFFTGLLKLLTNMTPNRVDALRVGLAVLLCGLPFAIGGIIFHSELSINISVLVIVASILAILGRQFIFISKMPTGDPKIEPGESVDIVGPLVKIVSLLASLATIAGFILKYVFGM